MTEIFSGMHPVKQLEMCGEMSKWIKPNGQLALPMPIPKKILQIEHKPDEDAVLISTDIERVFIGGIDDHQHIILDTGSSYNLIGRHLLPILQQRMMEAGAKPTILPTSKRFQFGGKTKAMSTSKILVPLILGKTRVETEVYVVDSQIPFLLGGNVLRQQKTEISVSNNLLIINNQKISLVLLPTGHMAISWV